MSETVINVENLSKRYVLGKKAGSEGLRHAFQKVAAKPFRWLKKQSINAEDGLNGAHTNGAFAKKHKSENEFWALKNVSFENQTGRSTWRHWAQWMPSKKAHY